MINIYSWNVNGIRAVWNKGALSAFIEKDKPDILCLQETKAQRDQSEVVLDGYEEFWNSAEKKGYSGTAIFTKIKPLQIMNGFPDNFTKKYKFIDQETRDSASEGRVLTAEFKEFYLVTVYTPNAKEDLSRIELRHKHWDPAFLTYVKLLENEKPVIFCGDLNVAHTEDDLANPIPNIGKKGFTNEEREGFSNFINAGFIDTLRMFKKGNGFYTWWSHWANARARNIGWRIDYFLVSEKLKDKVKNAEIHADILGSDHCPISIGLEI
jgi:exodeoxyribonuclease-3